MNHERGQLPCLRSGHFEYDDRLARRSNCLALAGVWSQKKKNRRRSLTKAILMEAVPLTQDAAGKLICSHHRLNHRKSWRRCRNPSKAKIMLSTPEETSNERRCYGNDSSRSRNVDRHFHQRSVWEIVLRSRLWSRYFLNSKPFTNRVRQAARSKSKSSASCLKHNAEPRLASKSGEEGLRSYA